ncbi:hypothetical protein HYH03_004739 [Edaphochlamys debaryana]|uniref:Protein kinase domain-containing protein n=1 Tax=Edaphochlamys debaryana TaxID=47281 RepID=A0A835Y6X1_9CHLO|nr:hypothetical protein HYH03_004739 [Edaphochlamys debaryana]|eukprot:KAG2497148.1 hypothetical protein HYH03_004739 [Edaphochlamys debaryana]
MSGADLKRYLAERICLPMPDADVQRLCQQDGELVDILVPITKLPEALRATELSYHVRQVLTGAQVQQTGQAEMYTAFRTYNLVEGTLAFIKLYLDAVPLVMDRNVANPSGATAKKLRPDFLCWVNNVLLFKGEEKATAAQMSEAVAELTSNLSTVWLDDLMPTHMQAPCMLAYAAAGTELQFFSVRKQAGVATAEPISSAMDLSTFRGRLRAFTATCNIWRLLAGFAETDLRTSTCLGQVLKSVGGKCTVTLLPGFVYKCIQGFQEHSRYTSFELLGTYEVYLAPVGEPCLGPPANEAVAARAVHGVLCVLAALHSEGFVHRDVRWQNVIRLPTDDRWLLIMLIDLENAGKADCDCSEDPFPLACWSRRTLEADGRYTAASDLRMVAEQLLDQLCLPPGGKGSALRQQLLEGAPSAAEALEHPWFCT